MSFGNFLAGVFLIAAGVVLLKYNFKVVNMFGRDNWFERTLGSGSTYLVFQLTSVLVVVFGIMMMFGWGDDVVSFILSPFKDIFSL